MRQILKDARISMGLKLREMAACIGVNTRMYQHMEAGTRTGRYELWRELAALTGVDQDDLRKLTTDNITCTEDIVKNGGKND